MTREPSRMDELTALAREGSREARDMLLRAVAELFLTQQGRFSAAELQHFDAILSHIAKDAEIPVKREIAERLAGAVAAPRGFINQLARDEISIAAPVLRSSKALNDEDLLSVIRDHGEAHRRAIARRPDLSLNVTDALAAHGEEDVLIVLAKNQNAIFSPAAMKTLALKARKSEALQAPLTGRYDLPPLVLTQMYFHVTSSLKRDILKRSDMIDPALVEEAVTANRHKILNEAMSKEDSDKQTDRARRFIAEQIAADTVNERLLKILIDQKRQTEFLYAFAHLIGVDLVTAKTVLNDKTFESLAIACRATGLEQQTFARIVFTLRKTDGHEAKALRILDVYVKVPVEAAERIMRFWRLRTDAAIDAARIARLSSDEPLTLTKRAEGW